MAQAQRSRFLVLQGEFFNVADELLERLLSFPDQLFQHRPRLVPCSAPLVHLAPSCPSPICRVYVMPMSWTPTRDDGSLISVSHGPPQGGHPSRPAVGAPCPPRPPPDTRRRSVCRVTPASAHRPRPTD